MCIISNNKNGSFNHRWWDLLFCLSLWLHHRIHPSLYLLLFCPWWFITKSSTTYSILESLIFAVETFIYNHNVRSKMPSCTRLAPILITLYFSFWHHWCFSLCIQYSTHSRPLVPLMPILIWTLIGSFLFLVLIPRLGLGELSSII